MRSATLAILLHGTVVRLLPDILGVLVGAQNGLRNTGVLRAFFVCGHVSSLLHRYAINGNSASRAAAIPSGPKRKIKARAYRVGSRLSPLGDGE